MSSEPQNLKHSRAGIAVAFFILLLTWFALLHPLPAAQFKETDIFWLLESGKNILKQSALPTVDPYSFASSKTAWIVYQWLSECIFALVSQCGFYAVAALGLATLAYLLFVLIFKRAIKLGANSIAAVIVVIITTCATYPEIAEVRPQLFSYVALFFLQSIAEDAWSASLNSPQVKVALAKIFVVGVFWTNCHISFPLGLAMLVLYLFSSAIADVVPRENGKLKIALSAGSFGERTRIFALMTVIFLAATLVNPYGVNLWLFLGRLNTIYTSIEMQPLHTPINLILYFVVPTIFVWRSVAPPRLLWSLVLLAEGWQHKHLILYFCLCSSPLVAQGVSVLLAKATRWQPISRASEFLRQAQFTPIYPIAVIALAIYTVYSQPLSICRSAPLIAAEYLDSHKVPDNLFCPQPSSNYLIYRYEGSRKVLMDTRADLYDASLYSRMMNAMAGSGWEELFQQYNINSVLMPSDDALSRILAQSADWAKVFEDQDFSLFVRSSLLTPEQKKSGVAHPADLGRLVHVQKMFGTSPLAR
ncbi:MAG TPA: hypothetical protein V6C81_32170 [Planktothrix sp.]|jgi:hypothetical protein